MYKMPYKRKTQDIFEVQAFYSGEWFVEVWEYTKREAFAQLKNYKQNTNHPLRIVKKRELIK